MQGILVLALFAPLVLASVAWGGTSTNGNACLDATTFEYEDVPVTMRGSALPDPAEVGVDQIELADTHFETVLSSGSVLAAYRIGLLVPGTTDIPATLDLTVRGLATIEGSQHFEVPVVASINVTDPTPSDPASGDEAADVDVSTPLADTSWDPFAVGIVSFTQRSFAVDFSIAGILSISWSCEPGLSAPDGSDFTPATPVPFETVEAIGPGMTDISVSPDPLDFGEVVLGSSLELPLVITAGGSETSLVVGDFGIEGDPNGEFVIVSGPAVPLVLLPGETSDLTLSFAPVAEGFATATLEVTSNDPDGVLSVNLLGTGALSEPGPEEQIREIIDILENGDVSGEGPGRAAEGRLGALTNMVETAGDLIRMGETEAACGQLEQARRRTDGSSPPPDFAAPGDATTELNQRIMDLQSELGCEEADPMVTRQTGQALGGSCGLGFELALLLPPIGWLHRRRRLTSRLAAHGRPTCPTRA